MKTKKITKAEFVECFNSDFFDFLNLTFVQIFGKIIGYVDEQGKICEIPTTKKGKGDLYKYFNPVATEIAYPQFSKGGKYKRHNGDPITVARELIIADPGQTCGDNKKRVWISKTGTTAYGNESNSYVIGETHPRNCKCVEIYELFVK